MLFWQNTSFNEDKAMTIEVGVRKDYTHAGWKTALTEKLRLSLSNNILVKGRLAWYLIANNFNKINAFGLQQGLMASQEFT